MALGMRHKIGRRHIRNSRIGNLVLGDSLPASPEEEAVIAGQEPASVSESLGERPAPRPAEHFTRASEARAPRERLDGFGDAGRPPSGVELISKGPPTTRLGVFFEFGSIIFSFLFCIDVLLIFC